MSCFSSLCPVPDLGIGVDGHTVLRFVGDVYTELILRFARSISSAATTLFTAKMSPWAKGGGGSKEAADGEEEEEIDVTPKKLEWQLTNEIRLGVRFAEMRLSDLISQNEVCGSSLGLSSRSSRRRLAGFRPRI
jgi:carnitine O-acetyltransferase